MVSRLLSPERMNIIFPHLSISANEGNDSIFNLSTIDDLVSNDMKLLFHSIP